MSSDISKKMNQIATVNKNQVSVKTKSKSGICIVTYPRSMASVRPLSNVVSICSKIFDSVFLITGNEGEQVLTVNPAATGYSIRYKSGSSFFSRVWGNILLQLKVAYQILKFNRHVETYLFFMGDSLLLPALVCKLTRKPLVWALAGSLKDILGNEPNFISRMFVGLEMLNYKLADKLVIYSPKLISEWKLDKYRHKIVIAREHYIIPNEKTETADYLKRTLTIGYIGRLSQEKGVLNFIHAIPDILGSKNEVRFLIGGDGPLKDQILNFLKEKSLQEKVELCGWIAQSDISTYLKRIKLLILPSYTEGLPNIMLESMICGTPVVATPVGAIPDVILDGQTGFIMPDNSPQCIAQNVLRALNHPGLEQIARSGKLQVQNEFTFENAIKKYRNIFSGIT